MDQIPSKFESPSISLRLPTWVGVYGVRERDCPTVQEFLFLIRVVVFVSDMTIPTETKNMQPLSRIKTLDETLLDAGRGVAGQIQL